MALANYGFQTAPSKTDFSQGSEYVSVQTSFYFFSLRLLRVDFINCFYWSHSRGIEKDYPVKMG